METQPAIEAPEHDYAAIGRATHCVITRLLGDGQRKPNRRLLDTYIRELSIARAPHVYGLAARQRVLAAASIYFGLFVLADCWRLVDAEVPVRSGALDLLFEHRRGRMRADELKSGLAEDLGRDLRERQVARLAAAGQERFGSCFSGVRMLSLSNPLDSYEISPGGRCRALAELRPPRRRG